MRVLTTVLWPLLSCSLVQGTWWKDMADFATTATGVTQEDLNQYTKQLKETIAPVVEKTTAQTAEVKKAMTSMTGAINSYADKISWMSLTQIIDLKVKPSLRLSNETCIPGVKVKIRSNYLELYRSKFYRTDVFDISVKINKELTDSLEIEIKLENTLDLPLQHSFHYQKCQLPVKGGKILLTQMKPNYVAITGTMPKLNSVIQDKLKKKGKANCLITPTSIRGSMNGFLECTNIKYRKKLGFTENKIVDLINTIKEEVQNNMKTAMIYNLNIALRKSSYFCTPEPKPAALNCGMRDLGTVLI